MNRSAALTTVMSAILISAAWLVDAPAAAAQEHDTVLDEGTECTKTAKDWVVFCSSDRDPETWCVARREFDRSVYVNAPQQPARSPRIDVVMGFLGPGPGEPGSHRSVVGVDIRTGFDDPTGIGELLLENGRGMNMHYQISDGHFRASYAIDGALQETMADLASRLGLVETATNVLLKLWDKNFRLSLDGSMEAIGALKSCLMERG